VRVSQLAAWLAFLALGLRGAAGAPPPPTVQAELLVKLVGYDKNFAARAGDRVHVYILVKSGNAESSRIASQMRSALGDFDTIAELLHDEEIVAFKNASTLAASCKRNHVAIVYLGPGFEDDIAAIAKALDDVDVLTVGSAANYVPEGVVLGFDLQESKPRLLLNIAQARKQHVAFTPAVVRLMKVVEPTRAPETKGAIPARGETVAVQ
jgi:hypothetical protein